MFAKNQTYKSHKMAKLRALSEIGQFWVNRHILYYKKKKKLGNNCKQMTHHPGHKFLNFGIAFCHNSLQSKKTIIIDGITRNLLS